MKIYLKEKDANCFVCGDENLLGLKIKFFPNGTNGSIANYTVRQEHIGWPGILHGGVLFTLMDEAVGWCLYFNNLRGVTAKAETRFRLPAFVGDELIVTGLIIERTRKLARMRAEVRKANNTTNKIAELEATMYLDY